MQTLQEHGGRERMEGKGGLEMKPRLLDLWGLGFDTPWGAHVFWVSNALGVSVLIMDSS